MTGILKSIESLNRHWITPICVRY